MLLDTANQIPPFVCRLIARKHSGFKPLSHADISKASGLPRSSVADLSRKISWRGIALDVADRFAAACGVNLSRPAPHLRWLRRSRLIHLKRGTAEQRRLFKTLLATRA